MHSAQRVRGQRGRYYQWSVPSRSQRFYLPHKVEICTSGRSVSLATPCPANSARIQGRVWGVERSATNARSSTSVGGLGASGAGRGGDRGARRLLGGLLGLGGLPLHSGLSLRSGGLLGLGRLFARSGTAPPPAPQWRGASVSGCPSGGACPAPRPAHLDLRHGFPPFLSL